MKISHWIIDVNGLQYGPFRMAQIAVEYAIKNLDYNWTIQPVWKPVK